MIFNVNKRNVFEIRSIGCIKPNKRCEKMQKSYYCYRTGKSKVNYFSLNELLKVGNICRIYILLK